MSLKVVTCFILKLSLIHDIKSSPNSLSSITGDSDDLVNCRADSKFYNLSGFSFNPHEVVTEDMSCLSFHMFNESGLVSKFNISTPILSRFIKQVQKGYQRVPYHNWHHGFSVLQFSFAMLRSCRLLERNHVSPLEGLAVLTAAMCHDLDHPGSNNQYQVEINNSLAQKYKNEGSILERHHINMTLYILQNIDTNFISHIDETKQTQFKKLISQIILATDLQTHLKLQPEIKKMSLIGFNEQSEQHRELLRSLIISCADLSDQGKDWTTSRKSVNHIMSEFFNQGDKEKQIGIVPVKMMDRDQADIPQLEIDFISRVIIPNFQILTSLYPETKICLDNSQQNLNYWQKSTPYFEKQISLGRKPLDIIFDEQLNNMTSLRVII